MSNPAKQCILQNTEFSQLRGSFLIGNTRAVLCRANDVNQLVWIGRCYIFLAKHDFRIVDNHIHGCTCGATNEFNIPHIPLPFADIIKITNDVAASVQNETIALLGKLHDAWN